MKLWNFFITVVIFICLALINLAYAMDLDKTFKSSIEIQTVQTRLFNESYSNVYRAVLSVLQDNRYEIKYTDFNTGVISAESSYPQKEASLPDSANESKTIKDFPVAGGILSWIWGTIMPESSKKTSYALSSNIEDLGNKRGVLVRLVLSEKTLKKDSGKETQSVDDLTDTPEIYQDLFTKINKEIFVRSNTR